MFQIIGHNITVIVDHLKNFDIAKNLDKLALYEFNESGRIRYIEVILMLYRKISNDKFMDRIITWDIKWNFYDRSKRSTQWPYQDQTR